MINRTHEEIVAKFEEIFELDDGKIEVVAAKDLVVVTVKQMYEYVQINLDKLMRVAEFFGTKNINDARYAYGGCETCDYGSSYEIELTIRPEGE